MTYQTADVFGVKSTLIKSYIERDAVDERFKSALKDGNEVIVYGSSKQGKTSLILRHLDQSEYVKAWIQVISAAPLVSRAPEYSPQNISAG
ncbi:hypothetical protein ACTXGQ_17670, partial [Marinobacter sp. 1Y8]